MDCQIGDDISWDTIKNLRAAGKLYTEQSGTLGADDVTPPEGSAKKLAAKEAEELLEATLDMANLSQEQIAEICDILDMDVPESTEGKLEGMLERRFPEAHAEQFPTEYTINGDARASTLSVDVQDVRNDGQTPHLYRIDIFLLGDIDRKFPGMVRHDVIVCQDHGLEAWEFAVSGENSWKKHAEMAEQQSILLPVFVEWLEERGVDVGSPDEAFGTAMKEIM